MRRVFWIGILALLAGSGFIAEGRASQETRILRNEAFGVGEWLFFDVSYGPIQAGTATLEVQRIRTVDGKPCYHVVSEAKSSGLFSRFFRVRDQLESFIDVKGIFPRRFEKHIREGKYKADQWIAYDQERHVAITSQGDTTTVPPFVQDVLSLFYFVRTQTLQPGDRFVVDNHTRRGSFPLEIRVHRRERVKVEAGTFDCLVVEPVQETAGLFKHKGKLKVWMTDDDRKLPVLMKSKVVVGHLSAELVRYVVAGNNGE
ncbi:MAG: DUF3108 domain-containing protein [Candidatus Latescibacteria bacterium]|nr:DUF3108 domain-containing protein [Candidatus Latescibacterota bacterium]